MTNQAQTETSTLNFRKVSVLTKQPPRVVEKLISDLYAELRSVQNGKVAGYDAMSRQDITNLLKVIEEDIAWAVHVVTDDQAPHNQKLAAKGAPTKK